MVTEEYLKQKERFQKDPSKKTKQRSQSRLWKRTHLKKIREYNKKFLSKSGAKEKQRDRMRAYKSKVVWYYSFGKVCCNCCGESQLKLLTLDHICNDGEVIRSKLGMLKGGNQFAKMIKLGFPEGIQVLCHNCNWAKSRFGKCPHIDNSWDCKPESNLFLYT